jgi:hypothetical protein
MTKNKFINDSGSTGSQILKFIVLVGLILGVCAFVMVLTTKCECKDKFKSSEVFHTLGTFPTEEGLKYLPSERQGGLRRLLQAKKDRAENPKPTSFTLPTASPPASGELGAGKGPCTTCECNSNTDCHADCWPAPLSSGRGCDCHDFTRGKKPGTGKVNEDGAWEVDQGCGSVCDTTGTYCEGDTVYTGLACWTDKCMATYCYSGKGHWSGLDYDCD